MEIINLEKDILIYRFLPEKTSIIGINIYVILNGKEAVIIDTGYRRHFLQVLKDLKAKEITISKVILTHFHPDHIGGLPRVDNADIIGSIFARDTLKKYVKNYQIYLPTIVVVDKMEIQFGRHFFKLVSNKGHSIDGLLIVLNEKYLFVGDDVICNNEGAKVLPFCSEKNVSNHVNSLKAIIALLGKKVLLPSHGLPIEQDEDILNDLISRLTYLYYLLEHPASSYEAFFKATNVSFMGSDWHTLNQIKEV